MIKPLTSLRFFFAFFVFLSHLTFANTDNKLLQWLQRNVFFEGYLGVSFFFILSGFVLAYSYKEKFLEEKITKKSFYLARFARIYPLHFLTLILAIPFVYFSNALEIGAFLTNLFLIQSFVPNQTIFFSFNPPAWSISDEMFFYLIFPLIIVLFENVKILKKIFTFLIPAILIIGVFLIPSGYHKDVFYVNPLIRSFDFILGILLYDLFKNEKFKSYFSTVKKATLAELFTILTFLIFFIFHNYFARGFRFSVYYWIPMCLIIYTFAQNKGYLSKLLSNNILVFLGEISFGFYMIHYLVITYGNMLKDSYFVNFNEINLSIIYFIVTIVLSCLSFLYYEKPMNTSIKKKLIKQ